MIGNHQMKQAQQLKTQLKTQLDVAKFFFGKRHQDTFMRDIAKIVYTQGAFLLHPLTLETRYPKNMYAFISHNNDNSKNNNK